MERRKVRMERRLMKKEEEREEEEKYPLFIAVQSIYDQSPEKKHPDLDGHLFFFHLKKSPPLNLIGHFFHLNDDPPFSLPFLILITLATALHRPLPYNSSSLQPPILYFTMSIFTDVFALKKTDNVFLVEFHDYDRSILIKTRLQTREGYYLCESELHMRKSILDNYADTAACAVINQMTQILIADDERVVSLVRAWVKIIPWSYQKHLSVNQTFSCHGGQEIRITGAFEEKRGLSFICARTDFPSRVSERVSGLGEAATKLNTIRCLQMTCSKICDHKMMPEDKTSMDKWIENIINGIVPQQ
jgi:hypothetical protein